MPHQTSRRGEGKRSAVFTCVFGAGALLVDRECVSTSCLGVGMSTRNRRTTPRRPSLPRHHRTALRSRSMSTGWTGRARLASPLRSAFHEGTSKSHDFVSASVS
jgi:hypothetical protein